MRPVLIRNAAGDTPRFVRKDSGRTAGRKALGLSTEDESDSGMREPAEVDAIWSLAEAMTGVDRRA